VSIVRWNLKGLRRTSGPSQASAMANWSATSALIRAGNLTVKEIPAKRAHGHGVCGRHGGTEERLTWGDPVASSERGFMPSAWGRRAGGVRGDKAESETAVGRKNSIHRPFLVPGPVKDPRQVEDGRGSA
jgi:hypothetical protein